MFRSDNTFNLMIGKGVDGATQITDQNGAGYLQDGEVAILDENENVLAGGTYATSKYIRVVQRSGAATSPLVRGQRIDGANVIRYEGTTFRAAAEQVSYIGFNTVAGAIDDTGTEDYVVRITLKHNKEMWSEQANQRVFYHNVDVNTTQQTIAASFAKQISEDEFTDSEVRAERVNSSTVFTALGNPLTVVSGSKNASSTAHGLSVGDVIRIGDVGTAGAVTEPVYVVAAVPTANDIVLDQIYQGPSATVAAADAGTITPADWGVKLTGEAQSFTVGKLKYVKVMFDVTLQNFGATNVTRNTEADRGNGTWEEIAELEFMSVGFDGAIDRVGDSKPDGRSDTVAGTDYETVVVEYYLPATVETVSGAKPARQLLIIAVPSGSANGQTWYNDLDTWMQSVPRAFASAGL